MTRDEAVSLIKAWLVRDHDASLDAKIVTQMKYVQESICENGVILPWFLISEFQTIATAANEERLSVPVGFLREHEECSLWLRDPDTNKLIPLDKDDYDVLANTYKDTGVPKAYALDDHYFRLKPTPDKVYTIETRVYVRDTKLDTNIENKWLLHAGRWFLNETARVTALRVLRDLELAEDFVSEATAGRNELYATDEARKHENRNYMMGDN